MTGKLRAFYISFFALVFMLSSCNQRLRSIQELVQGTINHELNPYQKVPLGASLSFATVKKCRVDVEVLGKIPIRRSYSEFTQNHEVAVVGLYPGRTNKVVVSLTTENNRTFQDTLEIETFPLPPSFPTIEVVKADRSKMEPGLHLIDMLVANNGKFLSYTILFDDEGEVRWYMDMSSNGQITYSAHRIQNGNWLYLNWIDLQEVNELGRLERKDQMWGHAGNHELIELNDGNLLMGGSKKDAVIVRNGQPVATRFDHVVIWDRSGQGRMVREWDMAEVLDVDRSVYPPDYSLDFAADWFHLNSIALNPKDNSLLVSGRNQGVVHVDQNNTLQWILAPHRSWGKAGRDRKGVNTTDYLLTAIDADGNPYPASVQNGLQTGSYFEWPTGQHAAQWLDNGNVLLFDNGLMRNFKTGPTYSRAVEYSVNPQKKTIQQVWEYGKERGLELYSPITSEVDPLPQTGNRLITAGNVRASALPPHAKLVEITYPDNREVFEAHIYFKDALGTKEKSWAQFDLVFRGARFDF